MVAHGVRFKAEDIWDAPEDGNVYEVIDGELYVTTAPAWRHQRALNRLNAPIAHSVFTRGLGEVVTAPTGVVLEGGSGVEPDLLFLSRERLHLISERGVEGPPDLVVEVLSPSTEARDRGIKMRRYAASGVPHYWLVDLDAPALEAYRLGAEGYELVGRHGPGSLFRPALFPGLEIPLDDLWS
ncbi:MAG TPA: Uma2 family endonuclease [Chloroflexota bacterium]|nr:Uma2 family endonuclease [Chloroflexota bacterium]